MEGRAENVMLVFVSFGFKGVDGVVVFYQAFEETTLSVETNCKLDAQNNEYAQRN